MNNQLIVKPNAQPAEDGSLLRITPESAGWQYVGFEALRLAPGETLERSTGDTEVCLVLLSGRADVAAAGLSWQDVGSRMNIFEKIPPYAVYVPGGEQYRVAAVTELELAVCSAPAAGGHTARLIEPEQVGVELRGSGSMERLVHNILPEQERADSLLVVEVFTPGGNWSSYPPHKHDRDALPEESLLEETYYYRIDPPQGYAVQRVYTDDRSLDETLAVRDGQAVLVPRGYHPVGAPAGYEVYYLNVMAGPRRTWKFHNDPDHEWMLRKS
ncbi:5-deoxy-glucuronate isomerase [Paenibacillus sp. 1P07SE]|uniref:5-deoxy-glucuronate isomerase n=1 Tax=Paenibacillus sp. 1P07SE TaxID=3132209 RepID=UPI0039A470F8